MKKAIFELLASRPLSAVLAMGLVVAPRISEACAVCMTGREDENRIAFELMTAFMTIIPFLLVGGIFWWLRGRLKELEARHDRARSADDPNSARIPTLAQVD